MRVIYFLFLVAFGLAFVTQSNQLALDSDELRWSTQPFILQQSDAIIVHSNLVDVTAVVYDQNRRTVNNLKREDFKLFDDGKPQEITNFTVLGSPQDSEPDTRSSKPEKDASHDAAARYVGIFFDDMNSTIGDLDFSRRAADKMLTQGLDPGERVGFFSSSGMFFHEFTDNVAELREALSQLRSHRGVSPRSALPCPALGVYQAWAIIHLPGKSDELEGAMASAKACCPGSPDICAHREAEGVLMIVNSNSRLTLDAIEGLIRRLGEMRGQRVLLVASSGFLTHDVGPERERVIDLAIRSNVTINTIDARGLEVSSSTERAAVTDTLSILAQGTGGQYFHNSNDLVTGFHDLSEPTNTVYMMGFSPSETKQDGTYHTLKVKLTSPAGRDVFARPGYYVPAGTPPAVEGRFRKLQQYAKLGSDLSEIPIEVRYTASSSGLETRELAVGVHVDTNSCPFEKSSGRQKERLIFVAALYNGSGQFVAGVEGILSLNLKRESWEGLQRGGLNVVLPLRALPGSYQLRQVVQEAVGGHLSATTRSVSIP